MEQWARIKTSDGRRTVVPYGHNLAYLVDLKTSSFVVMDAAVLSKATFAARSVGEHQKRYADRLEHLTEIKSSVLVQGYVFIELLVWQLEKWFIPQPAFHATPLVQRLLEIEALHAL
jgi:hypothetical protein